MQITKQQEVLVSAELAEGLVAVLTEACASGQLKGKQKRLATAYLSVLKKNIAVGHKKEEIGLSMPMVASILKILFMVVMPDSLVHTVMMTLEKMF